MNREKTTAAQSATAGVVDKTDVRQAAVTIFRQVPYLRDLPLIVLQELIAVATCYQCAASTMIFGEGEPTAGLYIIETGKVKVSRFALDGREHILNIFGDGDTFNAVSALDGGPNPATATAFSDVTLWQIRRDKLAQVAKRHPALAWSLMENMASHTRYLVGLVENLATRTVKGRLAHLLLAQAEANQGNALPRYLTHEEMASRLGTVREMVGRAIHSLTAAEIIKIERHQIIILDRERLAAEIQSS
ncbi:MAG: Crp/Fnr family transcriptional regulator [Caldilineaceae bacterium]|nr:Crp/Fnr family transcriptional regulator [Caldilineaceae bacterium]